MKNELNIYVDRLSGGKTEDIDEVFDPIVLEVKDDYLTFNSPLHVSGKAYLAEEFLILNLTIKTMYNVTCKICSEDIIKSLELKDVYLTEEVSNIRAKVYDVLVQVRDTVFINIPDYQECEGNCPLRDQLNEFLKESQTGTSKTEN